MEVKDILELEISDMSADGSGIGHYEGAAVFVGNCLPGDRVRAKVYKKLKNRVLASCLEILSPSEDRCSSDCPVSCDCGGCTLREYSYGAQLELKKNIVRAAFRRIGGFDVEVADTLPSPETDHYRNKAQFPVGLRDGKIVCGFYKKRSHEVVPHTACHLQPPVFTEILEYILAELNRSQRVRVYDESVHRGELRHIFIRQGYHSKEIMVAFVVRKDIGEKLSELCRGLCEKFPDIKSIVQNINPDKTNVILGRKNLTLWGKDTISDTLCGLRFDLSPLSFYQVNTAQAERLYSVSADFADLDNCSVLLDFYCGAGTIGLSMADRVDRLIGVEIIPEAVENARAAAAANNIKNAEFICSDAGKAADELLKKGIRPEVISIDPPRKGCDELMLRSLVRLSPKRISMISCNPATAARDCAFLAERGYRLEKIVPVDMFPHTMHVECVVLMSRVKD